MYGRRPHLYGTMKNFQTGMKTAFEEQPHQDNIKIPCVRKKFRKIFGQKHFITCVKGGKKMTNMNQTNISRHLQKYQLQKEEKLNKKEKRKHEKKTIDFD